MDSSKSISDLQRFMIFWTYY